MALQEYLDARGHSPFGKWFEDLDAQAAAKVTTALRRLEQGNVSNLKSVGLGVSECRIDFGPGYRVYLGQDGPVLILLLLGGTKKRQQNDIRRAQQYWRDYKSRKKKKED